MDSGIFNDLRSLLRILLRFVRRVKRLLRSPRMWKVVYVGAVALFVVAGVAAFWPVQGEPRILDHLYAGNTTKQMYLGLGLSILVAGVIVPVTRMPANLLRPRVWVALGVGLECWNYGGVWKVWHFIAANPVVGLVFIAGVTLIPVIVGVLWVVQRPPHRGTKFGKFNQPGEGG